MLPGAYRLFFVRPRPQTLAICAGIIFVACAARAVQYRVALSGVRESEARDRALVAAEDAAHETRRAPKLDYTLIWKRVFEEEARIAAEDAAAATPSAATPP